MEKRAFEQTGLIPRSIIRTFDRFRRQLLKGAEKSVIQEFRVSRYQVLVSVKCLIKLIIIPLLVNFTTKNIILLPITEYLWNTQQTEIFLNSYQEDRAFLEMQDFEEKLFFESLIEKEPSYRVKNQLLNLKEDYSKGINQKLVNQLLPLPCPPKGGGEVGLLLESEQGPENIIVNSDLQKPKTSFIEPLNFTSIKENTSISYIENVENSLTQKFQQKTIELAIFYNQQSIEAITNLFGDFITFITISFLLVWIKPEIIILKSFLTESIYSLSDTTKSFLLILLTDLLVGFHSPRGWEIFIEFMLRHFGLPENQDFIYLFVATFPVLLDTVFKYWIFRYLNQISPSTVATYHNMIE
jgi:CemA family